MITFILPVAGIGKRMELGYPKQFLEYNNKPLYITPLEVINSLEVITRIIVVTNKESIEIVKKQCEEHGISKVTDVIEGGAERQYSIEKAVKLCSEKDIIAVHDGVRPFIKKRYIEEALEKIKNGADGVVVGVMAKDTIKVVSDNQILSTPKRENIFIAHTPQIFKGEILKKAYETASERGVLGTDDSSLVEMLDGNVEILLGDYDNIKITTKEDLKYL